MSVGIIGAGTAGLCAARHSLQNGFVPIVFEQTSEIGGTWVYTDSIGTDEYGIDIHTSMYQGLRTNLPKEIMGYPDFPIQNDDESYVSSARIRKFLESYADFYHLRDHVKFLSYVIRVLPRANEWQVIVKDLQQNCINTYYFKYIMVCNGHYNTPFFPHYKGLDSFKGKQLHSHDFRSAQIFKDETVLVIGAGPSGMDLCNTISKVAKTVILSHHLVEQPKTKFKKNVTQKPDVTEINEGGAFFKDGSYETFTTIFFCTGYKYAFPFLSADCGIFVDENYVQPLYKHCMNIKYPTMAIIGIPFYICASQMMDIQARFVMEYWSGRKHLPSIDDMLLDTKTEMEKRWKKGLKKRQAHMMGPDQIHYYTDLAETAKIENIKPVMTKLHNESSQRFLDDLLNFRTEIFRIIDDETFIKIN